MNFSISWIAFPFFIFYFEIGQFGVNACNITDENAGIKQKMFAEFISKESVQFIYFNISSSSFANMSLDQMEWNKIIEWMWVTEEYKHFLTYPVDLDFFTFGTMRQNVRTLKLNITIENISDCERKTLWKQIYNYLFRTYNISGSYFCHRYFENQNWKPFLSRISHASIGYGFHCFQGNDTSAPLVVEKSSIIYITITIIMILFFFYPMLLPHSSDEKEAGRQLMVYSKADYPYTFRRLLLYVVFKTDKNMNEEALSKLQKTVISNSSGARLSVLISLVTISAYVIKYVVEKDCKRCLPPNAHLYTTVYTPDYISSKGSIVVMIINTIFSFIFLVILNSNLLLLSKWYQDYFLILDFSRTLFSSIPVSCFSEDIHDSESIFMQTVNRFYLMFSPHFWCKVFLFPINSPHRSICSTLLKFLTAPVIFIINLMFVVVFSLFPMIKILYMIIFICLTKAAEKISLLCFRTDFTYSVITVICKILSLILDLIIIFLLLYYGSTIYIGMSYLVQLLIYSFLVAIPHLYPSQVHIFLILTASITYMGKFFTDFFQVYRLLLHKIIELRGNNDIPVHHFDLIVKHCCPVKMQIFILFTKVVMTSFLFVIMYLTLNEVHFLESQKSFNVNTFLTSAFILLTPGLFEILLFESNSDKVEKMHNKLDEQLRRLKEESDGINISLHSNDVQDSNTQTPSWFRVFYLCFCGCLDLPFNEMGQCIYCFTLKEGDSGYVPVHCNVCDKGNSRPDVDDYEMLPYEQDIARGSHTNITIQA